MNDITVLKSNLIETVRTNRNEHRQKFLDAQTVYRARVIDELDARLLEARKPGGRIDLGFHLPEPVDYTSEYDQALAMLEWEVADRVTLDHDTFRQLVLNQWHWAKHFAQNTSSYLDGVGR